MVLKLRKVLSGAFALIFSYLISTSVIAIDFQAVEKQVKKSENALSAQISVAMMNSATDEVWSYNGNKRVPITSTFKTLLCAKLLQDVDQERRALSDKVKLEKTMLVDYSPVIEGFLGEYVTLGQACSATMQTSDNTAANIVLENVGGPNALTKFIRSYGDQVTRIDRFETELNEGTPGDPRDTTSAEAMLHSIDTLLFGDALSVSSKKQLTQWMIQNTVTGNLLRSVLPEGWVIADRSGAGGYGTRSINAVVWPEDGNPWVITIYVSNTKAAFEERNKAIVEIGKTMFRELEASQ